MQFQTLTDADSKLCTVKLIQSTSSIIFNLSWKDIMNKNQVINELIFTKVALYIMYIKVQYPSLPLCRILHFC